MEDWIVCSHEMNYINNERQWLLCPVCGNKTQVQIREDTELKNFPLFCPKCKQEILINVKTKKDFFLITGFFCAHLAKQLNHTNPIILSSPIPSALCSRDFLCLQKLFSKNISFSLAVFISSLLRGLRKGKFYPLLRLRKEVNTMNELERTEGRYAAHLTASASGH